MEWEQRKGDLESQIVSLKQALAKYEDRDAVLSKYQFIEKTGTYFEPSSGRHFCPQCLFKEPPCESPMKDDRHGWICPVCNKFCGDPERSPTWGPVR